MDLDKFKRRMIRSVSRLRIEEKQPYTAVWSLMKKQTGCDCQGLWERMCALTLKKIERLTLAEDCPGRVPPKAQLTPSDWMLFDQVMVHEPYDLLLSSKRAEHKNKLKPLTELLALVDKFCIEDLSGERLADAWTLATVAYNTEGRQCSPMLLQRRWYQLKHCTRSFFYTLWFTKRGHLDALTKLTDDEKPTTLDLDIAKRYTKVVTEPFLSWEEMINERLVILPEEFEIKMKKNVPNIPREAIGPDIVVVENEVETIEVASDSEDEHVQKSNFKITDKLEKSCSKNKANEEMHFDIEFDPNIKIKQEPEEYTHEIDDEKTTVQEMFENLQKTIDTDNKIISLDDDSRDQLTASSTKDNVPLIQSEITDITDINKEIIGVEENRDIILNNEEVDITVALPKISSILGNYDENLEKSVQTKALNESEVADTSVLKHHLLNNVSENDLIGTETHTIASLEQKKDSEPINCESTENSEKSDKRQISVVIDIEKENEKNDYLINKEKTVPNSCEITTENISYCAQNVSTMQNNTVHENDIENLASDTVAQSSDLRNNETRNQSISENTFEVENNSTCKPVQFSSSDLCLQSTVVQCTDQKNKTNGSNSKEINTEPEARTDSFSSNTTNKEDIMEITENIKIDKTIVTNQDSTTKLSGNNDIDELDSDEEFTDCVIINNENVYDENNELSDNTLKTKSDKEKNLDHNFSHDTCVAEEKLEFADDGIMFVEEDDGDEEESDLSVLREKDNDFNSRDEKNIKNTIDEKLLLCSVVSIPRINKTASSNIAEKIKVNDKNQNDQLTLTEIITEDREKSELAMQYKAEKTKLKTMSFSCFQKPSTRDYNPIQLCKNPDFNTRLKRLTVGFVSILRNRQLLKMCKPITIDVFAHREQTLKEGVLIDYSTAIDIRSSEKTNSVDFVKPSAISAQSLLANTELSIDLVDDIQESDLEPCIVNSEPHILERNKTIKLPNITEVRQINQTLLTAQVLPICKSNDVAEIVDKTTVTSIPSDLNLNDKNLNTDNLNNLQKSLPNDKNLNPENLNRLQKSLPNDKNLNPENLNRLQKSLPNSAMSYNKTTLGNGFRPKNRKDNKKNNVNTPPSHLPWLSKSHIEEGDVLLTFDTLKKIICFLDHPELHAYNVLSTRLKNKNATYYCELCTIINVKKNNDDTSKDKASTELDNNSLTETQKVHKKIIRRKRKTKEAIDEDLMKNACEVIESVVQQSSETSEPHYEQKTKQVTIEHNYSNNKMIKIQNNIHAEVTATVEYKNLRNINHRKGKSKGQDLLDNVLLFPQEDKLKDITEKSDSSSESDPDFKIIGNKNTNFSLSAETRLMKKNSRLQTLNTNENMNVFNTSTLPTNIDINAKAHHAYTENVCKEVFVPDSKKTCAPIYLDENTILLANINPNQQESCNKHNEPNTAASSAYVPINLETKNLQGNLPEKNLPNECLSIPPVLVSDDTNEATTNRNDLDFSKSNESCKKTILSDLMEMSGISAEDTVENKNDDVNKVTDLFVIKTFDELRFIANLNAQFFKLNVMTGQVSIVNVSVKKLPLSSLSKTPNVSDVIDLTEEEQDSKSKTHTANSCENLPNIPRFRIMAQQDLAVSSKFVPKILNKKNLLHNKIHREKRKKTKVTENISVCDSVDDSSDDEPLIKKTKSYNQSMQIDPNDLHLVQLVVNQDCEEDNCILGI